jgi:CheY-like chemotaxis protein
MLKPTVVGPAAVIDGIAPMVRRLIGEDIELTTIDRSSGGRVLVDPSQLEQVVVNLAVNARDAMPSGGRLTIEIALVDPEAPGADGLAGRAASVAIRVTDTGTGMDAATQARAFEPFFTTKEPGRGTGMGLAMVYGFVDQSGGTTDLWSELGVGTTIEVRLPRVDAPAEAAQAGDPVEGPPRGSATILLVEDEPGVRGVARRTLEGLGYRVTEARDGREALAMVEADPTPWDLLVTDVVMPRMGGPELAGRARELRPGLRVLLMSGFDGQRAAGAKRPASMDLLDKPFTGAELGRAVRDALGRAEEQGAPPTA